MYIHTYICIICTLESLLHLWVTMVHKTVVVFLQLCLLMTIVASKSGICLYVGILIHLFMQIYVYTYAKQKHLGCKKVRGQSEATLQTGRRDQKV